MITIERKVTAQRPVDEVSHYLSDFRTTAQWDPHTKKCTRTDRGPLGVGSTFDNTQQLGPMRSTLHYRVEGYEPGRSIRLVSKSPVLTATDTLLFTPLPGGGTEVTYTAQFEFAKAARPMEPLLRRVLERVGDDGQAGMEEALQRLPIG